MPLSVADLQAALAPHPPDAALVLGSGLGPLAERGETLQAWSFDDLPLLTPTSVHGHKGRLIHARWVDRHVLVFSGRVHFYEGNGWDAVTAPTRLAAQLGIKTLVLTNAAGGIRADLDPGCLMLFTQHLNCQRPAFWRYGMQKSEAMWYTPWLNDRMQAAAQKLDIPLTTGIYAAVTGPTYETPAEIRAYRALGADAIGMSTVPEAEAAAKLRMACVAISVITNKGAGLADTPPHHEEVMIESRRAAEQLGRLIEGFLQLR
ncbi:MAG TPA: purine-nucleoside phosphorylase [Gemmatales bacterium]|nr:purine-nucleoside phosphorylase [Gemmatales bacterium]HMP59685.1 purine-nucleoside phosphorylase [Gemmatales bacterium]